MENETAPERPRYVIGPDGAPLGLNDLPNPSTRRWTPRRKAEVIAAVQGGLLTLDEAGGRWEISLEEFISWQTSVANHGLDGLRTTRVQQYRA